MSMKTWKAEFYPQKADIRNATDREMLEACLLKWRGALPENCAKHGVTYEDHMVANARKTEAMYFDGQTCDLCLQYYCGEGSCANCPLFQVRGVRCDSDSAGPSIYNRSGNDPQPMIDLLEMALVRIDSGENPC